MKPSHAEDAYSWVASQNNSVKNLRQSHDMPVFKLANKYHSLTVNGLNFITLSSYPARQLVADQLVIWSQSWFPTCCRQVRAISTCRDNSNLVADQFGAGSRPARDLKSQVIKLSLLILWYLFHQNTCWQRSFSFWGISFWVTSSLDLLPGQGSAAPGPRWGTSGPRLPAMLCPTIMDTCRRLCIE